MEDRQKVILPVIGIAVSAAGMVEDRVIKMGGAELGRARLMPVTFPDWGIDKGNLVNPFSGPNSDLGKGSLVGVHIVDAKMKVGRKSCVAVWGVAVRKDNSAFPIVF